MMSGRWAQRGKTYASARLLCERVEAVVADCGLEEALGPEERQQVVRHELVAVEQVDDKKDDRQS